MNLALNAAVAAAAATTGHMAPGGNGGSIGSGSISSSASNANELLLNELNLNDGPLQNTTQYRDLIQLIKYQREKINTQQADLSKVGRLNI